MANNEYVVLDTRAFDVAISKRKSIESAYKSINAKYDEIANNLLNNWKGKGATAFQKDAKVVKKNIVSIFDILKTMCDTLEDCRTVFAECDSALGEYNREGKIDE